MAKLIANSRHRFLRMAYLSSLIMYLILEAAWEGKGKEEKALLCSKCRTYDSIVRHCRCRVVVVSLSRRKQLAIMFAVSDDECSDCLDL